MFLRMRLPANRTRYDVVAQNIMYTFSAKINSQSDWQLKSTDTCNVVRIHGGVYGNLFWSVTAEDAVQVPTPSLKEEAVAAYGLKVWLKIKMPIHRSSPSAALQSLLAQSSWWYHLGPGSFLQRQEAEGATYGVGIWRMVKRQTYRSSPLICNTGRWMNESQA